MHQKVFINDSVYKVSAIGDSNVAKSTFSNAFLASLDAPFHQNYHASSPILAIPILGINIVRNRELLFCTYKKGFHIYTEGA